MKINYDEVMERMKSKLGFKEDKELAALFGISTSALSQRKRNKAIPYDFIIEICRDRGISIDYVIKGRAEYFNGSVLNEEDLSSIDNHKMMVIPYYQNIRCAAGLESCSDEISYIIIPREGYPELSNTQYLHAVTAQDDSMEGNIMSGAILLVDFTDKGMENGKIYIISHRGEVMTKRVFKDPSDPLKLLLRSDNIYYPQFTVARNEIDVVGRVVFVYNRAKLV
jgi:SOS-response transcriptional repressor LexA